MARNAKFQEFVEKALEVALDKVGAVGGAATAAEAPATRELNVQELLQAEHPGSQNSCWLLSRTSIHSIPDREDVRVYQLLKD